MGERGGAFPVRTIFFSSDLCVLSGLCANQLAFPARLLIQEDDLDAIVAVAVFAT